MNKWAFIVFLSIGMVTVNEQPAEAGFFRRGPIRRFLFGGGPIRRRMFAGRTSRRGFCGNCRARRVVPRCGAGIHGGRCGFGNPNFRDFRNFRNFRNFQDFGDLLSSQFDPGLNLSLNPFFNPNAAQFLPFQNGRPLNFSGGFSPSSAQANKSELERIFAISQEPDLTEVTGQSWAGFCEDRLGGRKAFKLPAVTNPRFSQGALAFSTEAEDLFVRSLNENKLVVRTGGRGGTFFCLLEKQPSN